MLDAHPRVAFISDIHGNIDALDAVLADIRDHGVQAVVCLGDIVGYGGAPAECVRKIGDLCPVVVMGNHEAMTVFDDIVYLEEMPSSIRRPIELARTSLTNEELSWLRELPLVSKIGCFTAVHSSLHHPGEFPYVFRTEDARRNFKAQTTPVSFHGHSHVPIIWEERGPVVKAHKPALSNVRLSQQHRYTINVGSVGQPRDGDPRASYVIYERENRDVTFRRIPYDIESARRRIFSTRISGRNADRLSIGE
ncbi:metallophosphoesterase [Spartobacteria bacterium LR76]|nr:metallophosphoesterase [Spartobacteria bacterium LR76]